MPTPSSYRNRKEKGLCVNCASRYRPLLPGRPVCAVCASKDKKRYKDRTKARNNHLKTLCRITTEIYNKLYESQKGICPICLKPLAPMDQTNANAVDHNHRTGDVRGILHKGCNVLVGFVEGPNIGRALEWASQVRCEAGFDTRFSRVD